MAPSSSLSFQSRGEKASIGALTVTGLVAAVAALVFFAWLAHQLLEGDLVQFDSQVRAAIHHFASPGLTTVMQIFTALGEVPFLFVVAGAAAIAFWRSGSSGSAALLLVAMGGAGVLDFTLKLSFRRTRPAPFFDYPVPQSYSFPSGHALFSFCLFAVLAALLSARNRRPAERVAIWAASVILIGMIGLSRIYLGVHYPSDVIAGYAAAFIWVMVIAAGNDILRRRRLSRPAQP